MPPSPNGLTTHCEKPNKKRKSGHSTPVSAIAVARFIPVVSPNNRPLESPRMRDSVILGSPQRKLGAVLRLIAYYSQHGQKVRFLYSETGADLCYGDLDLF